jgi:hypothetical protein
MQRELKIWHFKAEANGYRAGVATIKNGKIKILETKWFKTEKEAKNQATAWKRKY